MEKIIIYGAGLYCKAILSGMCLSQYEIIGSMDSDPNKWNEHIGKYIIMNPNELKNFSYDKIVITARDYEDIAYKLIRELSVPKDKILFVSEKDGKVHKFPENSARLQDVRKKRIEKAFFQRMVYETLQESLLMECLENGEFEGYHEIIVVGEKEQLQAVKRFFFCNYNVPNVYLEDPNDSVLETGKYLLTSSKYQKDLIRLFEEKKCTKKQCLVIPLFDVESTVVL